MNELKEHLFCDCNEMFLENGSPLSNDIRSYYLKDEVDAAIAELKAMLKESEDARYEAGANAADYYQENRRLKRALYKACANWADVVAFEETEGIGYENSVAERWRKMENKCLKKMEEYK